MQVTTVAQITQLKDQILGQLLKKGLTSSEAEDVFQSSMVKAIESFDSIKNPEKLENWFRVVVKNKVQDVFRARAKDKKTEKELLTEAKIHEAEQPEKLLCQCVKGLVSQLKEDQRKPLEEIFFEEKSTKQVAKDLGVTENVLKVRVHRAKKKLREELEKNCGLKSVQDAEDCEC